MWLKNIAKREDIKYCISRILKPGIVFCFQYLIKIISFVYFQSCIKSYLIIMCPMYKWKPFYRFITLLDLGIKYPFTFKATAPLLYKSPQQKKRSRNYTSNHHKHLTSAPIVCNTTSCITC